MNRRAERPLTTVLGWSLPGWLLDVIPVSFILVVGAASLVVAAHGPHPTRATLVLGLLVAAGSLLLRHRAPLVVLGIALAVSLVVGYGPVVTLPVLLATFTVAEHMDRRPLVVAGLTAAGTVVATGALHGEELTAAKVVTSLIAVGLAVAVGLYLRARADYIAGLRERAERLERERELLAQQAVGEERVRIARELHDVVAHNVSLMVVQAQALAATGGDGAADSDALGRVAGLGRDALSEMHRMLAVLRLGNANGSEPELEPQPGVHDLPALIERTRQAGLDAVLTIDGPARDLPAAIDLSVYRIVQEALTNVIRHARATHATVILAYGTDALDVTVLDDGAGLVNGHDSGGHGLIGMRERVAMFGGRLETGRRQQGEGYRVRALIPVR
ncbi:MAG TPA: histidine kinase [Solirubrobacteraceae bacterium]|nr:histidine kinase [Solirubrobacteraceae bacterium]